ncbi:TIGR04086 family membrane protein [Desulfallas thermosapovorans]|uniref:Putative membrane protein (TIGR04086 family) n=1 Tax=Desulfallas thermosapovorans DSM 6562 TaxID=1121431 RepID=A0A5S4ZYV7_9FIRM|nr:TIGR04086 family membrane protein [Desulfallas thermosapovorans]TYO98045.1 putative membrane protein (TIGR04086 family) [Desulfallas thermosapovorans DSM 6562]
MFRGITLVSWSHRDGQAGLKPGALWSGLVWALTSTAFICAALLLWVFMTAHQVYHFSSIIMAGICLGTLLGGGVSGRTAGNLGWLHGLLVGFIFFLVVTLLLVVWNTGLPAALPAWLAHGLVVVALSTLGGIIGVNIPAARPKSPVTRVRRNRFGG